MSAENDFLAFATGAGANVLSQSVYAASAQLGPGQQPGVASSALNNKALRQATYIASCLAQYLANTTGNSVLDDGDSAEVLTTMALLWPNKAPTVTKYTVTGTATGYIFTCTSANATVGATYTDSSSHTYTVLATISAGTQLLCSGTNAPTGSTLTKASGTGDSSITFSATQAMGSYTIPTSPSPMYLEVYGVAGGGGGGGSYAGGSGGGTGGNGGVTAFGVGMLQASGGTGGQGGGSGASIGGAGGGSSIGTGPLGIALTGGTGQGYAAGTTNNFPVGGMGASSPFGGGGGGGTGTTGGTVGGAAPANSGSGGGGAGSPTGGQSGCGGGAGGWFHGIIPSSVLVTLGSNIYYAIGPSGAGGTAGSGGAAAGGAAAAGLLLIKECYQ